MPIPGAYYDLFGYRPLADLFRLIWQHGGFANQIVDGSPVIRAR
jgi:hypothetical protein